MNLSQSLISQLRKIPGQEGFICASAEIVILNYAQNLKNKGFEEKEILKILTTLYFSKLP